MNPSGAVRAVGVPSRALRARLTVDRAGRTGALVADVAGGAGGVRIGRAGHLAVEGVCWAVVAVSGEQFVVFRPGCTDAIVPQRALTSL